MKPIVNFTLILLFLVSGSFTLRDDRFSDQVVINEVGKIVSSIGFKNEGEVNLRRVKYRVLELVSKYGNIKHERFENEKTWVEVVVYKYENEEESTKAYNAMKDYKFVDDILKEYHFLFPFNENIVLVKSGCNQSKDVWKTIIDKIKSSSLNVSNSMDCYCGSLCKKE